MSVRVLILAVVFSMTACQAGAPQAPGPSSPPNSSVSALPTGLPTPAHSPTAGPPLTQGSGPGSGQDPILLGYFTDWGVYSGYLPKNIVTSGAAKHLTHLVYAFGNVVDGKCAMGDEWADYQMPYTAADSVDGVADQAGQALLGAFNQLTKLKAAHPHIKVLWSFGGWTWSAGFGAAAQDPTEFANSCYVLVNDARWAGLFDGIDIDWEYPNACGLKCDTSGREAHAQLLAALRSRFGADALITGAISGNGAEGGDLDASDYAAAAASVDFFDVMTYDYFGAWAATGPTAPHSALTSYVGIPEAGYYADAAIQKLISTGISPSKLNLGIGFYGRGWKGVNQSAPGGTAVGPAPASPEAGMANYNVLASSCLPTGTVGGTAYAYCGKQWWSYDTPATISGKMDYVAQQGLGGAFFWELSGDSASGDLVTAMAGGQR